MEIPGLDLGHLTTSHHSVFVFQFKKWKHAFLTQAFPQNEFHFAPMFLNAQEFWSEWAPRIRNSSSPAIFLWGIDRWGFFKQIADEIGVAIYYFEDGFIRSATPHASRAFPMSLTIDDTAPHFDWQSATRLERILSEYDFQSDAPLLSRARAGISQLLATNISKYNGRINAPMPVYFGNSLRKKVLVVGQVENDAAVLFGSKLSHSNNDVVRLAASENPDADIIFRIHPDIMFRVREARSHPADVAHLCQIMTENIPIGTVLNHVDHVYTITSLVGFEALMRNKAVTVLGQPFYSGWGLTDDREPNPRRTRRLNLEELFAGAYLLYPRYFAKDGRSVKFEEGLELLKSNLDLSSEPQESEPKPHIFSMPEWRVLGPFGLFGWRYLFRFALDPYIQKIASEEDVIDFRRNPALFFAELQSMRQRQIGRILFPSSSRSVEPLDQPSRHSADDIRGLDRERPTG